MHLTRQKRNSLLAAMVLGAANLLMGAAQAQDGATGPQTGANRWPQASLNAEASAQVVQDTVKITLAAEFEGASQTKVAEQLSKTLADVMQKVKGDAKVKASSGNFRVWPMNNEQGKISNWRGQGEIYLESTDLSAASELAAKVSDRMPIANLAFSVSPKARARQEAALLAEAAQAFRERAKALTDAFGFASYTIRTIDLGGAGARYQPAPRMMAMAAQKSSAPVPLEAGTETVTVSMRGSIFLHSTKK